jgi:Ca-activated chloride channel family protein
MNSRFLDAMTGKARFTLAVALAVVSLSWIAPPVRPAAAAEETPRIQIVFDGSGSMWGRIPGDAGPKFAVAREAIRQSLPRLARTTEVGLALFGHRRRGDCSDVEMAQPLQPVSVGQITVPLEKLNPKGRGPLALALMAAADALPGTPGRDSLILIHDDLDNCQGNPCEVARNLNRVRPKLTIHVVSLGMKEEDAKLMSCVATMTGGKSFTAQDAPSAMSAIDEALRLASLQVPVPAERTRERPKAEPPTAVEGPPGLRLSAVLASGGQPLDQPVQFRVFRQDATSGDPLAEVKEPRPSLTMAPGTYVVEATLGFVTVRQPVEVVSERPTRAAIALNAGSIQMASATSGANISPSMVFSLLQADPKEPMKERVLWVGPAQDLEMFVPAGTYRVVMQDRQFRAERQVTVSAGKKGIPLPPSPVGRVQVKALDHGTAAATAEAVLYRVLEDDPNVREGRREVARSAAEEPVFTLPAGTYHLIAEKGTAEVRELIALKGGDDVRRILNLKLGSITLATRLPGMTVGAEDVSYRVYRLRDGERFVARADRNRPRLDLPAGRYKVEARVGRLNAAISREIDVADGTAQEVLLEPPTARIQLRLVGGANGHSAADVFWEVLDDAGRAVWRSMEAEPREFLAAGRYTVRAETRERQLSRTFDVRAGEARTLEVPLN